MHPYIKRCDCLRCAGITFRLTHPNVHAPTIDDEVEEALAESAEALHEFAEKFPALINFNTPEVVEAFEEAMGGSFDPHRKLDHDRVPSVVPDSLEAWCRGTK